MDLTVAAFDDPSRFRPTSISAPRACIGHGSTLKACRERGPTSISRWSTNGSRRLARFPTEASQRLTTGPPPTASSWPGARSGRAGR